MCSSSVDMRWESTRLIVNRSMSISHCPDFRFFGRYLSQLTYNKMRRIAFSPPNVIRLPRRSDMTVIFRGGGGCHRPISSCPEIVFSERWGAQTGTFRPAHAVYETPAHLPAVVFRLGPAAFDQSATVLLLLCRTWRVSDTAEASLSLNVLFMCALWTFLWECEWCKLHAAYQTCLFWISRNDVSDVYCIHSYAGR